MMTCFARILWTIFVVASYGAISQELPKLNSLSLPDQLSIDSRARLLCVASSGDQPIDFQWEKDGTLFTSGKIEQLDEWTSSLTVYPLTLNHIGNYTCVASNNVGSTRVSASLFVTASPEWIIEPSDVKIRTGDRAVFHCKAKGSPKVKITWMKESESPQTAVPLSLEDDFHINENGSLVLSNAQKSKSGLYICEVTNGIGEPLKKRVRLTVYESPRVQKVVDHVTVERGQTAHISCLATGDAPLAFIWMKNKRLLETWSELLNRLAFSELPSAANIQFSLSISSTELDDEGFYSCIARNEFGSDQKDIRLMLVERPQAPQHVELVDIWSRSARVKWSAPKNGNSPILRYTVEYWSNPGGHWNETMSSASTSCILRSLKPFTKYSFHVWASNSVGDSEPSEQMQFTTAKEEPSAPPVDFKLEDVGSTFVRISWRPPPHEHWNGVLAGYYVGYKQSSSKLPFTYNTVEMEDNLIFYVLRGLRRSTRYLITVRSFNDVGSGPPSEEISVKTLNQDPPPQPVLIIKDIGSTFVQINWILSENEKLHATGYTIHYRKNGNKWNEISVPDSSQASYTLTNLDSEVPYQIFVTSHGSSGVSEPSEIATVRTSAEAIFQQPSHKSSVQNVDDVTQILYIVVPVAVATVIIVIVIVTACVYVYSKRPLPVSHPYGDLPASKNFSYMSTAPRQRDVPITVCGGNAMKYGSPYSTVPLTRPEQEDDEPIYESVMDEIRCKIKQRSFDDDVKIGTATVV